MKSMSKRSLSAILVFAMLAVFFAPNCSPVFAVETVWDGSVAESFDSGTGTEDDPYIIKTAEQLAYLAQYVNSGAMYMAYYWQYFRN